MRCENSKLLGRLADITTKWQATVVENAALNAKNGEAQAQLGEMQHALAMMQRERDELRRALQQQQQQQPAMCQQQQSRQMQLAMLQQQQQEVAWAPVDVGHNGVAPHAAGAGHWAPW
jgi:TolA-binding protein